MEAHAKEEANIESWGSYLVIRKFLKKRIKQKRWIMSSRTTERLEDASSSPQRSNFGNTTYRVIIRSPPKIIRTNLVFISQSEHKNFREAKYDKNWISVTWWISYIWKK